LRHGKRDLGQKGKKSNMRKTKEKEKGAEKEGSGFRGDLYSEKPGPGVTDEYSVELVA